MRFKHIPQSFVINCPGKTPNKQFSTHELTSEKIVKKKLGAFTALKLSTKLFKKQKLFNLSSFFSERFLTLKQIII